MIEIPTFDYIPVPNWIEIILIELDITHATKFISPT
jgi:hypothetical protein